MAKKCKCKNKKVANKFYTGGRWANAFNTMGNDPAQYKDGVTTNVDKYGLTQGGHNAINTLSMALNTGLKAAAGQNHNTVGDVFTTMGGLMGNFPGWIGWIGKAAEAVGHGINATIGYNVNKENVHNIKNNINAIGDFQGNTSDINSLYNSILNAPTLMNWEHSDLGTQGLLSTKIDDIDNSLHQKAENALNRQQRNIYDAQQNVALNTLNNLESGFYAYGGPFNMNYTGVMSPFGNQFKQGGYKETLLKDFNNGIIQINTGGSHESNPLEGVQIGVDPQGIPNLVEEGEIIWNDYVFSDRLKVPKSIKSKYKIKGITYADAAKELQKESEERPFDPISKNGLNSSMQELAINQEELRMKKESNKYARGGRLANKYSGNNSDGQKLTLSEQAALEELEYTPEEGIEVKPIQDNWYRKAPIFGSAVSVLNDIIGGNEVDYSNANLLENAIRNSRREVGYRPIGDYLTYTPFDIQNPINQLNAQYNAARRTINNTSGGNRGTAIAGILASDYNYGNALGDLAIKAQEYNQAQRQKVADFNRATNMTNAEMGLKTDMFNAESLMKQAYMYDNLATFRQRLEEANRAEKIANLTNLLNNIGALGKENYAKEQLRYTIDKGAYKGIGSHENKCGGRIRRKKKGVTI